MVSKQVSYRSYLVIAFAALLLPAVVAANGLAQNNASPYIEEPLFPDAAAPGGAGFTLTVVGTGFFSGSVVNWNGSPRTTTFVSKTELTASILASDIKSAGTASVTVSNPSPGGGISNVIFFPITNSSTSVTFGNTAFAIGASPLAAATADFRGDGLLDLALANDASNTVSILLGNGNGTFQTHVDYATGSAPLAVVVGDFNGDGKLDLAVANNMSDTVSILLGNGDGTFQPHVDYATGSGPASVSAGDFNGDGKLDLAVANFAGDTISILLGNGDGTFETHVDYATGAAPISVAVGDLNRDGNLDLITADFGANEVSVLLGNGNGTFGSHTEYPTGIQPDSVVAADFRKNGQLDVATANQTSNTVSVLLGNGDGTLQNHTDFASGNGPTSLALGDFNGDGKLDIATSNGASNTVSVLLGNGNGTFQTHEDSATGSVPYSVAAGDFNNDGRLDLATANSSDNTVSALLQISSVTFTPASLSFGNQNVGTTSPPENITLTNIGSTTLQISTITITGADPGDFTETNNCGSSLGVGASCSITVTFKPAATGTRTASVSVSDNAPGSPQTAGLTGTGTAPAVKLSPTSLSFGNQLVGTTSPAQNVTLTNTGTGTLTIISVGLTGADPGDFAQTNTCGSSVAAGASCTISVTFKPTTTGVRTASVSVSDNASGSPQTASLTGTGTAAGATLSPTSLNFGNQAVGTTSPPQNVTLTNSGTATLQISSITLTGANPGDFGETNTCGSSLSAGASCTISVTFKPTTSGVRTASVSVSDNAPGSPQTASLTGTGIAPGATLSPASLNFGNQIVGTTSPPQNVTLTNSGTATLQISSITITGADPGDFGETNACGSSLSAGASCTISVTFKPTTTGTRTASVSVSDNASGSPQTASLTGTGTQGGVTLSPPNLSFSTQLLGTTSPAKVSTLTNNQNTTLTISSIIASGDFAQTNTCGSSLPAGGFCTISVTFKPTLIGTRLGAVTVNDNGPGGLQSLPLSGVGTEVKLVPSSLNFGDETVGKTSPPKTVTLTNVGTTSLSVTSISVTGTNAKDFAETNTCGTSVGAGRSCNITVTFTPSATGTRTASVSINDNGGGSPQTVPLSGTGTSADELNRSH